MNIGEYAYVRVSTKDQSEARQLIAMQKLGLRNENIYIEKRSGKDFDRPKYQQLLRRMRPGDILYIKSIDRLGRNYAEIQEQWRILTREKGVDIVVLDMPLLDTRYTKDLLGTFLSDIVLQLLSFVAQNERELIRQRQAEGIAAARKKGIHLGRPSKSEPENFPWIFEHWSQNRLSTEEAARLCGMSRSTFYRRVHMRLTLPSPQKVDLLEYYTAYTLHTLFRHFFRKVKWCPTKSFTIACVSKGQPFDTQAFSSQWNIC